ncbi:MAG: aldo/keto reductase [Ignavibacteria bacterium]|nr:aldo/keto reductase [Ignavibacteria bacterium]
MSLISSAAQIIATEEFSSRFPELKYKKLGKTGLIVSACGFGAYRVDYRVKEHFDSIKYALTSGINLIDTSSNYSDGGSEILVGNVLVDLVNSGKLKREEVVIVTKGGYIQGRNLERAKKMSDEGNAYRDVTEYSENLWHCIHPDFLKDQVKESLERMKLEKIDVYLLHNPEYFLDSSLSAELETSELRHEYYRRISEAFEFLESEIDAGRIAFYGISSNSFVKSSDDPVFTSLEECIKAAEKLSPNNRFNVIQFPLNLLERGAVVNLNQSNSSCTLLELAKQSDMGVLINRPLNAISENKLLRLADFEVNSEHLKLDETRIIAEIGLLESMEEEFMKEYLDFLNLSEEKKDAVNYFLRAGKLLRDNWKNFGSIEGFNDVKKQFLIPRVNYALTTLVGSQMLTDEMKSKLDKIAKQINNLMSVMESIYGFMANTRSKKIHEDLNTMLPENCVNLSLSQKSILILSSLEGVSSVLVGMRQKKYVDDVLGAIKTDLQGAEEIMKNITDLKRHDWEDIN